jgi:hypothetical protein
MAKYNIYDPNRAREDGYARLLMLADARNRFNQELREKAEAEAEEQERMAEAQQQDSLGNWLGTAAQGAAIGTMFAPGVGSAIGAGAGALLGLGAETYGRYKYNHDVKGDKSFSGWDALGKSVWRAPTAHELGSIGGAGMSMAASQAAQRRATKTSAPLGNPNAGYTPFSSNQSSADQFGLAAAEEAALKDRYAAAFGEGPGYAPPSDPIVPGYKKPQHF